MTRLYIVEGLPCSGKSTTAAYAARLLESRGKAVTVIDEGTGEHPADYEFHAFFNSAFTDCPMSLRSEAKKWAESVPDGWVVPLCHFQEAQLPKLLPHKIYDGLSWLREKPVMLEKWRQFAKSAEENRVYLFNCVLLQNPLCETMMRFDLPEEESLAHIAEIAQIIAPLEPAVIYLKNEDVAQRIQATAGERPGWLEGFTEYHVNGAYGKRIHAQGFGGLVSCLAERQRRELSILEQLPVKRLVLSNAHRDWDDAYQQIADFIEG